MEPRLHFRRADPAAVDSLMKLQDYVRSSGLDPSLVQLVDIRASQINRCGY